MTSTHITLPHFAIRHGRIGGVESAIYNLARGLCDAGADVTVARSRADYLAPEYNSWTQAAGIRVDGYLSFGRPLAARFAEETWFGAHRIEGDVVYPNYFLPPVHRQRGRATVIIHDFQHRAFPAYFTPRKRRWLDLCYARALRSADRVFFISEFERQQARRFFPDNFTAPSTVIYNAIDIDRYHRGQPGTAVMALANRPFILSVAHQHRHKNIETLVHAFAEFAAAVCDVRLVLVGTPSAAVRATVDTLPDAIRARVVLTGFISDNDLGHLYDRMSLFALPSRYEGFGMPAVEALAHDRPVVLADAGALREVTHGLASYVPDEASPAQWAAILRDHIDQPGIGPDRIAELLAHYAPTTVAGRVVAALDGDG